jgi:hypothetical protein
MSNKALVYDVCSAPDGMTLDKIVSIWKEHNLVLYDSFNGKQPLIYDYEDIDGALIDVSTTSKEKLVEIQKLLKP